MLEYCAMAKSNRFDADCDEFFESVEQFEEARDRLTFLAEGLDDPDSTVFIPIAEGEPWEIAEQTERLSKSIRNLSFVEGDLEDVAGQEIDRLSLWQLLGATYEQQLKQSISRLIRKAEIVQEQAERLMISTPAIRRLAKMSSDIYPLSSLPTASQLKTARSQAAALLREVVRAGDDQPLSGYRTRGLLVAILELGAQSLETRRPADDIVLKAFGPEVAANDTKKPLAKLVKQGYAKSYRGRGGGYYLTRSGIAAAKKYQAS